MHNTSVRIKRIPPWWCFGALKGLAAPSSRKYRSPMSWSFFGSLRSNLPAFVPFLGGVLRVGGWGRGVWGGCVFFGWFWVLFFGGWVMEDFLSPSVIRSSVPRPFLTAPILFYLFGALRVMGRGPVPSFPSPPLWRSCVLPPAFPLPLRKRRTYLFSHLGCFL